MKKSKSLLWGILVVILTLITRLAILSLGCYSMLWAFDISHTLKSVIVMAIGIYVIFGVLNTSFREN